MVDYQGNPNKDKEPKPEKVVAKVVSGEVIVQKKSVGRKFREIFVEMDIKGVARYLGHDVFIPAFRSMIVTAGTEAITRIVYGQDAVKRARYGPGSRTTYTNYSQVSRQQYPRDPSSYIIPTRAVPATRQPARLTRDDYILATKEEAELVLEKMNDILDQYDVVTVRDLNELVGFASTYVDEKWGWIYLGDAPIRQVREGFLIDLPPADPIQ